MEAHDKHTVRQLIGEGQLEPAVAAALAYAEQCHLPDIANDLINMRSRINDHQQKWTTGLISYADYSLVHAQITHGLTALVSRLPDTPTPAGPRRHFLTEAVFKKRIFQWLLIIKVAIFLRLLYQHNTGGFNTDQFQSTASLLLPALAAYVSVALGGFLREHKEGPQPDRYISGTLVSFAYWLFPIYAIVLITLIEMKVKNVLSYTEMNFWLVMAESVLGGYIGQMLNAFFKKE
jgi:hypothetical protein